MRNYAIGFRVVIALAFLLCIASASSAEQKVGLSLTDIGASLYPVTGAAVAWGDYDGDGDFDLALSGDAGFAPVLTLYRNAGPGGWLNAAAGLPGYIDGSLDWGDFDNDGDIDLLATGYTGATNFSRIYVNQGSEVFVQIDPGLTGVRNGSGSWGDFDGDGDFDIVITGSADEGNICRLYRNDGSGVFTPLVPDLTGVTNSSTDWGDYDGDGDLDLLVTGHTGSARLSRLYANDGSGTFSAVAAGLTDVYLGDSKWGDYDADGDLDIALVGASVTGSIAKVYRNDGSGAFHVLSTTFRGLKLASVEWGDCDNDGDLDLLFTGAAGSRYTTIYSNEGGDSFVEFVSVTLPGVQEGAAVWGDFDADGDLDIALAGNTGTVGVGAIYRAEGVTPNLPPLAPAGLEAVSTEDSTTFFWRTATDPETPATALTYNLRVGTAPGGCEILSPMSVVANGRRLVPANGNLQHRILVTLPIPREAYFWSVQAVDGAFAGSPFAAEQRVSAVHFVATAADLPGTLLDSMSWGDYDGDGDLDLLATGSAPPPNERLAGIYRNEGDGTIVDIEAGWPGVHFAAAEWGDYDGDGDLDAVVLGQLPSTLRSSRIYRNDGVDNFSFVDAGLTGLEFGDACWGDYDNDGDLDLLLGGLDAMDLPRTILYRNDGQGGFVAAVTAMVGVEYCALAWGDYDNDGDLDILLSGMAFFPTVGPVSKIYRNDSGVFTDIAAGLIGVFNGAAAWGDYDADGDLDVLLSGGEDWAGPYHAKIYRNDGPGGFIDIGAGLQGSIYTGGGWGDYDSDGDLDILMSGHDTSGNFTRVWRNSGDGTFIDIMAELPGVLGVACWVDFDGDGDLDIALNGDPSMALDDDPVTRIALSEGAPTNTRPEAPTGLATQLEGNELTFSWNPAVDAESPAAGLSYNLRVGTSSGGSEIFAGMAMPVSGKRYVVQAGNAQLRTSWTLERLEGWNGIYWSVQAIDGGFESSEFAPEQVIWATGVEESVIPTAYRLYDCVPNPFNPSTRIEFDLPEPGRVELAVFDVAGRRVRTLLDQVHKAGHATTSWNGQDDGGCAVASGVYFYRFVAGGFVQCGRMVLVR